MTNVKCCPGPISRRDALRLGALSALGLGLGEQVGLSEMTPGVAPRARACILLWLDGGPSHLETWDVKPSAPSEVRGPFRAIETNVPGIEVSECLSQTARITDKIAIIRSMTSPLGEHGVANHYLLTGFQPTPALQYPSFGSVITHEYKSQEILPRYVAVPEAGPMAGAGYLGTSCQPFVVGGDPGKPNFSVRDLEFYPGVDSDRIDRRRTMLNQLDRLHQQVDAIAKNDPTFEQAFRLITSADAKKAFDLNQESSQVRDSFGPRTFGQSCLLARRLIERGVPFVTVTQTGWDTHADLVLRLKEGYAGAKVGVGLIPTFDQGFAALARDLHDRGLLKDTLVVAMGEFGRTPKINTSRGRDHWPRVFSVALAGGGIRGGQVYGASDSVGESPAEKPVTPADLAATIFTLLGIDPKKELHTSDGRPVPINQGGRVIRELFA